MILIIRIWLIKLLAGKMGLILNVHAEFELLYPGQSLYADNINPLSEFEEDKTTEILTNPLTQ